MINCLQLPKLKKAVDERITYLRFMAKLANKTRARVTKFENEVRCSAST